MRVKNPTIENFKKRWGITPKDLTNGGRFTPKTKPFNPFASIDLPIPEQWPELTEFDFIQANMKPVEATPLELGYEIDRLKNEVQKQTDAKNKAINSHHDYMDEYRKLENDFYNRGTEMKKLKYADEMNVLLMKQNLELRERLAKLEHG